MITTGVVAMACSNLVRRFVSSSLPFRRTHALKPTAADSFIAARSGTKVRDMSSAASQERTQKEMETQIERRDEGSLSRERDSPLRAFDLMDSFFPTRNLRSMIESMDRIFDDPFFAPSVFREAPIRRSIRVPWDFKETDDAFRLRFDMPGLGKDEVKVYVEDDHLVIKGEHSAENKSEEEQWASRSHGSYSSRILLPDNANPEQIKAELKNGVLTVTVPKVHEDEVKKNVIDVQVQ